MNTPNDTIVAPATAAGGAIAVVRMSGPSALAICDTVFSGARRAGEAAGYTVLYGTIADGARVLDDVLVTVFRAPHSYTGEDAVEISCHGSRYIVRELLALLVRRGARMATPGEFTSRAFLGGKLDLSQAEAVADLIASGSRAAHTLATDQMRGGYSAELETLRGELLRLASLLELELDFGEEEVEFADRTELRAAMERIGATPSPWATPSRRVSPSQSSAAPTSGKARCSTVCSTRSGRWYPKFPARHAIRSKPR